MHSSRIKVLPFGLAGGPALWQQSINKVLWKYLDKFCTAYLNEIPIYNGNFCEHKKYVCFVLAKLRKFDI